jgi:hypothetical protein
MNYTSTTGSSVHQTVCLILSDLLAQNSKLIATLSKGGDGETKGKEGNGSNNGNQGKGKGPGTQDNDAALREWISKNTPPHSSTQTPVHNYWTPLASPPSNHFLSIRQTPPHRRVTFTLSPHHVDKESTLWRRGRPPDERTTYCINPLAAQQNMRMGVLNGTIPSAVSDTGATSSAFLKEDPSIPTGRTSSAIFHLPNGAVAPATTINKLLHNVRTPARDVNIVPSLVGNSLLSTNKFTDAGYTAIYDKNEVNSTTQKQPKLQSRRKRYSKDGVAHA